MLVDVGETVQEPSVLAALLAAAESQQTGLDAVLVSHFCMLFRNVRRFAELRRTLANRGVRMVPATESTVLVSLADMLRA